MGIHQVQGAVRTPLPAAMETQTMPGTARTGTDGAGVRAIFTRPNVQVSPARSEQTMQKLGAGKDAARATIGARTSGSWLARLLKPGKDFLQSIRNLFSRGDDSLRAKAMQAETKKPVANPPLLKIREYQRMPEFADSDSKQARLSAAIQGRATFFKTQNIGGKEALAALLMQSNAEGLDVKHFEEKHADANGWVGGNRVREFNSALGQQHLLQHRLKREGPLQTNKLLADTQISLCRIAAEGVSPEFLASFNEAVKDCTPDNYGAIIARVQQMAYDAYLNTPD